MCHLCKNNGMFFSPHIPSYSPVFKDIHTFGDDSEAWCLSAGQPSFHGNQTSNLSITGTGAKSVGLHKSKNACYLALP